MDDIRGEVNQPHARLERAGGGVDKHRAECETWGKLLSNQLDSAVRPVWKQR